LPSGLVFILKVYCYAELNGLHIHCLRPFSTFFHFKTDAFAFTQGLEADSFDGSVMYKNIRPFTGFDETVTLFVIKPFYSTFRHLGVPFLLCSFLIVFWCATWSYFGTVPARRKSDVPHNPKYRTPRVQRRIYKLLIQKGKKKSGFIEPVRFQSEGTGETLRARAPAQPKPRPDCLAGLGIECGPH
jgi:hypothetical protein